MMNDLTEFQEYFIRCACDLHFAIFDFSINDEWFEKDYGITKEKAYEEIEELRQKLL